MVIRVAELPDPHDGGHALVIGDIADNCLVRIHSRCLYGDALQSDDCDCGNELGLAMDLIQDEGSGVLVYLEQEGRGAGLIGKAMGLRTTEQFGLDTYASYARLGLPSDSRKYVAAAQLLSDLGLTRIRLLTNSPAKIAAVESADIRVSVEPLVTRPKSERARRYLDAQREHHKLPSE
ncbi:GTP cyclohydrolase [Nocardia aurea]|uniref:GTP cyclohydrolase n=1 Tax=Nocardia aurea TaxID=2144174 RepID=UPI0033AC2BFB